MKLLTSLLITAGFIFFGCQNIEDSKSNQREKSQGADCVNEKPERVEFMAPDGVEIVANVYEIDKTSPVIVLCHQARFNKFEYEGIAQKLNKRGFNCVALDQRSGGPIANQVNETVLNAEAKNKPTDFLDAEQDIVAAVNYASERYNQPIILWGSSYSSTLVLYIAIENENENISAAIAFSPGNYFEKEKGSLIDKLSHFNKPFFITSSKGEIPSVKELLSNLVLNKNQIHFEPKGEGHHGSRALWEKQSGGDEYWKALDPFLEKTK